MLLLDSEVNGALIRPRELLNTREIQNFIATGLVTNKLSRHDTVF